MNGKNKKVQEIVSLNNEGADLLDSGNAEAAMRCFVYSVKLTKILLLLSADDKHHNTRRAPADEDIVEGEVTMSLGNCIEFTPTMDSSSLVVHHGKGGEAEQGDNPSPSSSDDEPFMFQQPIRIRMPTTTTSTMSRNWCHPEDGGQTAQTLAAISLFNLGLSFHLLAKWGRLQEENNSNNNDPRTTTTTTERSKNCPRTDDLRIAVQLYESAFGMQASNGPHSNRSAIFFMAILNNLAYAHTTLGNYREAEKCQRQLLSTMLFLIDMDQSTQMPANISFDCFFQSTCHLIFKASSKTAAAA